MFTQQLKMEVKGANDRIYTFLCSQTAPLGEINDALFTMKGVVLKQLQEQYEKEGGQEEPPEECCKEQSNQECNGTEGE